MDTFLVRVWTEVEPASDSASTASPPGETAALHGLVRHVRTGAEARFSTPAELVTFLMTGPGKHGSAGSSDEPAGTGAGGSPGPLSIAQP